MSTAPWSPGLAAALLAWGTLVGVDLVSVPQVMLSRPLVAKPDPGDAVQVDALTVRQAHREARQHHHADQDYRVAED